ncbi:hypothetical protein TNCV_204961 [Trichonephila clavipes]|nr:hypothetical protein TNCV_204961 [Trichonephila clavipes]
MNPDNSKHPQSVSVNIKRNDSDAITIQPPGAFQRSYLNYVVVNIFKKNLLCNDCNLLCRHFPGSYRKSISPVILVETEEPMEIGLCYMLVLSPCSSRFRHLI